MLEMHQNAVDDEDELDTTPVENCPVSEMDLLNLFYCEASGRKGMVDKGSPLSMAKLAPLRLVRPVGDGFLISEEGKLFLDKWFDRSRQRMKRFKKKKWRAV
jgi:hypothetical protein